MQVYGRGIIRRLPPMLHGDPRRIRMVYSLMFSLPGTPVLFYGEEIGMGEDLAVGDRTAVRTPMQWTAQANGGFSRAPKRKLAANRWSGGFGPEHVNASDQRHDPDSLLQVHAAAHPALPGLARDGLGRVRDHPAAATSVLVHGLSDNEGRMVALHNFRGEPATVTFPSRHCELAMCSSTCSSTTGCWSRMTPGRITVQLDGYGFRWLRVLTPEGKRLA